MSSLEKARKLRSGLVDFRPPMDNIFLKYVAGVTLPTRLKKMYGITSVDVRGLEHLQALSGKRTVICPNHPGGPHDPGVIYSVGLKNGEYFNYLAAREVFDEGDGKMGFFMQRLGCYSVVRGTADRESFKTTKRLLVENVRKLVIFVEGETSRQNDVLMPIEPGVIQMSFWALDELAKSKAALEPVFLLPIGIKYIYTGDISAEIDVSLARLESELKLTAQGNRYERLRNICMGFLAVLQREYNFQPDADASVNDTIKAMRNHILDRIAQVIHVKLDDGLSTIDRVRTVRNGLDGFIFRNEDDMSDYERKLHDHRAFMLMGLYEHIWRVQIFIAIYDGYLAENMTQERFAEVLDKLESEMFGSSRVLGERVAIAQISAPINLLDSYEQYKKDKRGTLSQLTETLFLKLSEAIKQASTLRQAT